jgi:CBS domain-containing protein
MSAASTQAVSVAESSTREHKQLDTTFDADRRRRFVRSLLTDLRALEQLQRENLFERGVTRIGAEQEVFLVNKAYGPAPGALDALAALQDPHFTTELGLFNLEMNADPQELAGRGLHQMETQLAGMLEKLRTVCAKLDMHPVLAGILPTIGKTDLGLNNMVPSPRYQTLNRVMNEARGQAYDFSIRGMDELRVLHDSVMVEACNASFQVHLQLAEPERFAHHYNLAQMLLAPVLATSTNSPVLFGRRLWAETRIALFEQSCDIRTPGLHLRETMGRVSFGRAWLQGSVVDLYKENIARFRALVGTDLTEDALATIGRGDVPELKALRLHNGTIYRWNRGCYGVSENGKPHLRIELRVLPSGPSIADEVANAALWLGLMVELGSTLTDIPARMRFEHAHGNLYAAAREGLGARFTWLDGEDVLAQSLILERLLPLAERGLAKAGTHDADIKRYLGIVEHRTRALCTGSRWTLKSLAAMQGQGTAGARLTALVAASITRQQSGEPVAHWAEATLAENDSANTGAQKVAEYMTTDVVSVQPEDPVELVADIMRWEHSRYVPVEDAQGRLVGLVTGDALLAYLADNAKLWEPNNGAEQVNGPLSKPVSELMHRNLITVTPDTPILEAVALLRTHRLDCLPVLQGDHLVALLTADNIVHVAEKALVLEAERAKPQNASEVSPASVRGTAREHTNE